MSTSPTLVATPPTRGPGSPRPGTSMSVRSGPTGTEFSQAWLTGTGGTVSAPSAATAPPTSFSRRPPVIMYELPPVSRTTTISPAPGRPPAGGAPASSTVTGGAAVGRSAGWYTQTVHSLLDISASAAGRLVGAP